MTLDFEKSYTDNTLFNININGKYIAVLVYVDDIIITANDDDEVTQLKTDLKQFFKLCDLGPLKYFFGLEIARSSSGISVCQRKYTMELLEDAGLLACKPSTIPMDHHVKLRSDGDEPLLEEPEAYRRLIGRLMYLTITRPYITFAINKL